MSVSSADRVPQQSGASAFLNLPSSTRQASYFATGCLAGAATLPIEYAWSVSTNKSNPALGSFLRTHSAAIYRAGVRFWIFDITKRQLPDTLPVWIKGGIGGASGGFAEVCAQSLVKRSGLQAAVLGSQSLKLFFCFGTYTYLSTTLSPDRLPPSPFWWCWMIGATAGGLGSTIVARLEGVKGRELWTRALPKGALTIGTVIAVQVTSCAGLLRHVEP